MSKHLKFAPQTRAEGGGNLRGERNKVAAFFTHFLTQKSNTSEYILYTRNENEPKPPVSSVYPLCRILLLGLCSLAFISLSRVQSFARPSIFETNIMAAQPICACYCHAMIAALIVTFSPIPSLNRMSWCSFPM